MVAQEGFLETRGAKIWFKMAGQRQVTPVVYLHGGPGHNSYAFEHGIGRRLEERLQLVYFDQRACGRSNHPSSADEVTMQTLVDDLEDLRQFLNLPKIHLLAHSFGGLLALEYARRFAERVDRVILIDITADLPAMMEHQVNHLASVAAAKFPDCQAALRALAASSASCFEKLCTLYRIVDRERLQRELFWYDESHRKRNAALDFDSYLLLDSSPLVPALAKSGYLTDRHEDLMRKIPHRSVLFAGEHSQCVGRRKLEHAAEAWEIPMIWFERSGHLPHVEEPDRFAAETYRFFFSNN